MGDFSPDTYFELTDFAHRHLFTGVDHLWEAFSQIEPYLHSLSLGTVKGTVSPDAYLVHPELITIGRNSTVEAGAYIEGPCYIGERCTVRHGAYIRGNVLTGDDVVIGHATEVKQAVFLNGAKAAHFAYVGDSILGNEVNLGAGTRLANFRFDGKVVTVSYQGNRIDTGRRKLGAIIGDHAQLGCNSVTNPGTFVGQQAIIYPCTHVGGLIEAGTKVGSWTPA